jgi:hypothetical protein
MTKTFSVLLAAVLWFINVKAQLYKPLAADKTYGNYPLEAISIDSGITYISCDYEFQSGNRNIKSSRFTRKTINSISKTLKE